MSNNNKPSISYFVVTLIGEPVYFRYDNEDKAVEFGTKLIMENELRVILMSVNWDTKSIILETLKL